MKPTTAIALAAALACAVASGAARADSVSDAAAALNACLEQAQATPQGAVLTPKMSFLPRQMPTVWQLSDPSSITPSEAANLVSIHPFVLACAQTAAAAVVGVSPTLANTVTAYFNDDAATLSALLQHRLTWGQYSAQAAQLRATANLVLAGEATRMQAEQSAAWQRGLQGLARSADILNRNNPRGSTIDCTTTRAGAFVNTNCR